jgi:hypothetical protein
MVVPDGVNDIHSDPHIRVVITIIVVDGVDRLDGVVAAADVPLLVTETGRSTGRSRRLVNWTVVPWFLSTLFLKLLLALSHDTNSSMSTHPLSFCFPNT